MKHPFQVSIPFNDKMGAYDLVIAVGDFEDKALAEKVAKAVIEFLEASEQ